MVPVRAVNPSAAIGNYWATRRQPTETEVKLLQALAQSEGTTFKGYLPRGRGDASVPRARPPVVARLNGSESVLLVENDAQVRKAARGILRRNGYQVIEAKSASLALELAAAGGRFDLLLTDVSMPQLGGMQLIERLRSLRPDLRAVCMSGYAEEAALRHGVVQPGVAFVQKPLTPEALLSKVREALELDRSS